MMSDEQIQAEQDALQSLVELLEKAQECRAQYVRAGMQLPEPLKRLFGSDQEGAAAKAPALKVPGLPRSSVPRFAKPDWVSIRVEEASPQTVVLAVLRQAKETLRAKEVTSRVQDHLPDVSGGSVANIGTRLDDDGMIIRTDEGWELADTDDGAIISDGYLWAPADAFSAQELAAHRREALQHVLSLTKAGLQATQIEEQLHNCSWLQAPVSKDLVRADLKVLKTEKKIRRRGNTRKWELVPDDNSDE